MTDIAADEAFDAVVASANGAMVVVTTAAGEQRAGCLVGFHSQTSIEPRRYTVWLSKANHTYRVGLAATHLAVHFLTDADRDLADVFGALSGDDVDKFARCDWAPGPHGVPLLRRCPNRLVVARTTLLDDGRGPRCGVRAAHRGPLCRRLHPAAARRCARRGPRPRGRRAAR